LIRNTFLCLIALSAYANAGEFKKPTAQSTTGQVIQGVKTTAYTHTEGDHIEYGSRSAVGSNLKYGAVRSAAADWSVYPVGTVFQIEGDATLYIVDDYGSALVGTRTIDLYKPSQRSMDQWGARKVNIKIIKWGSYQKSLAILRPRQSKAAHVREMVSRLTGKAAEPEVSSKRRA
jgi:3D (Asp-Asp-Asp) domain-containing protein